MTQMTNSEAYRILTRELTNMHHTERTALDNSGWVYDSALELVRQGRRDEAVELVTGLITEAGQIWRAKLGRKFINALPMPKLAPHGGCNWQGCVECNPN